MIVYDVDHQEMMFKVINKLQKHQTHVKSTIFDVFRQFFKKMSKIILDPFKIRKKIRRKRI